MAKRGYVYMLTNKRNSVLYVGVTSNLIRRIWEHKSGVYKKSFTHRYNVHKLVYYEVYDLVIDAIAREKQLKNWQRDWKIALIEKHNPAWADLYDDLLI